MARSRVLTHERFNRTAPPDSAQRELGVVREITHALLAADRPEEVFQFALDRVSPLLHASFSALYLVDGVSELMRLAAAHNWPSKHRSWVGEMKVRMGFGPSGEAAAERRVIEVRNVTSSRDLEDWAEVASELGFKSLVALPLLAGQVVLGSVTFYFDTEGTPSDDARSLMRIVTDQMAAAAEKARFLEAARRNAGALEDITAELELQYKAVHEARRLREEFLSNVSHELRTPLTSVLGHLALAQEEMYGALDDRYRTDISQAHRAALRLQMLIEDLLLLSSLKSGTQPVDVVEFDPATPIQHAVAGVEPTTGVRLEVAEANPLAPRMRSDLQKTTKILVNLLSNAFKFTGAGTVSVSCAAEQDRVRYQVKDSGIGMSHEDAVAVFEEFRQVDGSVTRPYAGSGLGLSLARQLARLLGGDVTVVSAPGDGSTFTLELPLEYDRSHVEMS